MKKLLTLLFAVALTLSLSSATFAQDAGGKKEETKKTEKKEKKAKKKAEKKEKKAEEKKDDMKK
jgi:ribosomal protein L12E/L44/L45/RPP1/RPP2